MYSILERMISSRRGGGAEDFAWAHRGLFDVPAVTTSADGGALGFYFGFRLRSTTQETGTWVILKLFSN